MDRVQAARTGGQEDASLPHVRASGLLRLAIGFVVVAFVLIGVFDAAEWYAGHVSIPRYCGSQDAAIELVRETLRERRPASGASLRPHVVAAKLIYLIPRQDGEAIEAYLDRLRLRIAASCR